MNLSENNYAFSSKSSPRSVKSSPKSSPKSSARSPREHPTAAVGVVGGVVGEEDRDAQGRYAKAEKHSASFDAVLLETTQ